MTRQALDRLRRCIRRSAAVTRELESLAHDLRHTDALPGGKADARFLANITDSLAHDLRALAGDE